MRGSEYPDLSDPATLGCVLALARDACGCAVSIVVVGRLVFGGFEWAICDLVTTTAIYGFASEAAALVGALESTP